MDLSFEKTRQNCRMRGLLLLLACAFLCPAAWSAHGYALWDDLKYPPDFRQFDYANADAPKGGELRLVSNLRYSTFDKYNPFTIKGSPPAYLGTLMFDSLLAGSMDETASGYGLLAEDVEVAPDRLSATFRLRPEARFHNGKPVLAADVKYSYDTLVGPYAQPGYKTLLEEVAGVDVVDARTVRFRFKKPNRELPLTVGGLPVFSRDWGVVDGKAKRFDEIVSDIPIGSGPYRIGPVHWGRDITYVRDPQYWGRGLAVKRGAHNFDRITVKIYRDATARLEALKAGEFDLMTFYSAGDWARRVNGRKFDSGELVKKTFAHKQPAGFQSYVLNSRRPHLQDPRVREALGLAMDFEYMDRQMFYRGYPRVTDLFGNTECQATGTPSPQELELLEPWRGKVPDAVFGPMYKPPVTEGEGQSLRNNLRKAQALLKEAGWEYRDGALRNAKGEPMVLEYLDSRESGVRTLTPWIRSLEKLGIQLRFAPVDFALYQQRLDKFEFDVMTINFPGTHNPGQALAQVFGSKAADVEGGGNYFGVKSPAVDALLTAMTTAETKEQLLPACRAFDRVIMHSHYLIPQWTLSAHRVAYNAWRLDYRSPMPPYAGAEEWVMFYWWLRNGAVAKAR
jgi:microcin C transport system substrate-binding protein